MNNSVVAMLYVLSFLLSVGMKGNARVFYSGLSFEWNKEVTILKVHPKLMLLETSYGPMGLSVNSTVRFPEYGKTKIFI
jgi:hypothetical protein